MYETVLSILHAKGWPADCAPAPEATKRALETQTPEEVAFVLDGWVNSVVDTTAPPAGITGWVEFKRWVCHRTFSVGREFWEYGTALALGQFVEVPVERGAEAQSVSEWLRNQSLGRKRDGYLLVDPTPEGAAEMERRKAKAADVPLEWRAAGKADIWALAVVEGMIPATVDALSAYYSVKNPSLGAVRGLTAQEWLDNLRAADKGRPPVWGPK